jgi:hypothetical protein
VTSNKRQIFTTYISAYIPFGKSERKRPLGRYKQRWEGNIKMNLKEIGWEGVDWVHTAPDRWPLVNTVTDILIP